MPLHSPTSLPGRRALRRTLMSLLALLPTLLAAATAPTPRIAMPTVLVTDIGDDIDDTWALAHALRSPELDLKLVLTDMGHPQYRGAIAAKLLEAAGRTDVGVALGVETGATELEKMNQAPWVRGYDLGKYPGTVYQDGVGALIDFVKATSGTVTVIAVGPVPSLAAAVQRDPSFAAKCRFVGMYGSFDLGYGGDPEPAAEWNVRGNVSALRTVLAAPWQDILITPLDTCGLIDLEGANYRAVWQAAPTDPLVRAVIENYCVWAPRVSWMNCDFFVTRSTTLFDDVAVYLAYSERLVEIEPVKFRITDDGFTVRDANGPFQARAALRWKDQAAFENQLTARLLSAERKDPKPSAP